jgi:hypothetical protein
MRSLFVYTCLFFLVACKQEIKVEKSQLVGKWNFAKAYRDGKETQTMNSAFFEFGQDDSFTSNLFDAYGPTIYKIEGDKLIVLGAEGFRLDIKRFDNDTLVVGGNIKNTNLEFFLAKQK